MAGNTPLKAYTYKGYTINKTHGRWHAIDPKTSDIIHSTGDENAIRRWADENPK